MSDQAPIIHVRPIEHLPEDAQDENVPYYHRFCLRFDGKNDEASREDSMPLWKSHLEHFAWHLKRFPNPGCFKIVWSISGHIPCNDYSWQIRRGLTKEEVPGTLFILDSSFNPPTRAHLSLALSALCPPLGSTEAQSLTTRYPKPHRLLLLFSTHNATKNPAPAPFEHRLSMMQHAANDFAFLWQAKEKDQGTYIHPGTGSSRVDAYHHDLRQGLYIDVGITAEPYYSEKSRCIDENMTYSAHDGEGKPIEGSKGPKHVHLVGFDTFMRVVDPKYYKDKFDPPLSALDAFFTKHELLVMLRANEESEGGDPVKAQKETIEGFRKGARAKDGLKPEWLEEGKITVVDQGEESKLISSTAVRNAVEKEDWALVEKYCTPNVAGWVRHMEPYKKHEEGIEKL